MVPRPQRVCSLVTYECVSGRGRAQRVWRPLLNEPFPSVGCLSTESRAGRAGAASRVVPCPLLRASRGLEAGEVGEDALCSGRSGSPPCSRGSPGETARQDHGSQTSGLWPVSLALLCRVPAEARCSPRQLVTGPAAGAGQGAAATRGRVRPLLSPQLAHLSLPHRVGAGTLGLWLAGEGE